jgi:HlyD family secretion protein
MSRLSQITGRLRAFGLRRSALCLVALVVVWLVGRRLMPASGPTIAVIRQPLVQSVVATGRIRSLSRARLGPAISGTIAKVLVREGDRVIPGQRLVQLDDAEARAQVLQARAAVSQAEAGLAGMGELRETVSQATLRSADVGFRRAETNFNRTKRLVEAGAAPADQLDLAGQSLEAARSQRDIAEAELRAAQSGGANRRGVEANLELARAAVATALARLANTRIESPAAGRVLTREVEPGDAVQPGRGLMALALDGRTQIVAVPDEKDVARLREGQPAIASADAYPGETFPARVTYVAPAIDPNQGTVEVRLDVDSAPPYLLPDMTVSVQVETARIPAALVVPTEVVAEPSSASPWVLVVKDGRAEKVPITIGVRGERLLEVVSGLTEGDQVIANPKGGVRVGDRVRAQPRVR